MSTQWETDADIVRRSACVFVDALSVSRTEADGDAIAEFVVLASQRATDSGIPHDGSEAAGTDEAMAAGAIHVLLAALHLLEQRGLGHDEAVLALREQLG